MICFVYIYVYIYISLPIIGGLWGGVRGALPMIEEQVKSYYNR